MKNIITFLVLFAISSIASYGQIIQSPVALPSPNAAGLGCYGEVPVSPYTGMACIEIPLCELKTGSHIIPISLTYNTGGVRVDQHPGWVGLNWNLNAGGCITRTVYGIQDEYELKIGSYEPIRSGYYYNHSKLSQEWDSETSLGNSIQTLINDYEHNRNKGYEYEPDRFSFNFLDYHGNFYLDSSGEWVVQLIVK